MGWCNVSAYFIIASIRFWVTTRKSRGQLSSLTQGVLRTTFSLPGFPKIILASGYWNECLGTVVKVYICRQAEKQDELFQESNTEGIKVGECLHRGPSPGPFCSSGAAWLRACIWSLLARWPFSGPFARTRRHLCSEGGWMAPRACLIFGQQFTSAPWPNCKDPLLTISTHRPTETETALPVPV